MKLRTPPIPPVYWVGTCRWQHTNSTAKRAKGVCGHLRSAQGGEVWWGWTCLGVVVLHAVGVGAPCEDGDLHLGHQGVVDGGVRQPEAIGGPPVGDVRLEDLLCGSFCFVKPLFNQGKSH